MHTEWMKPCGKREEFFLSFAWKYVIGAKGESKLLAG